MNDVIGKTVGRYHVLEKLGEGGMATVYKAFDTRLEREVAVKFLSGERLQSESAKARFGREAKALAMLNHPNILTVHDFGDYNGRPFLVTEYIPGGTLKKFLGKPIHWRTVARILAPVARGLEFAHRHGILHRDIKPANILITEDGQPIISDFGIAKILEISHTIDVEKTPDNGKKNDLTAMGIGVGTPEYMAPEQAMGNKVDRRADIYALGVIFFEMITGRKPFQADTPLAVLMKHVNEPLPRPQEFLQKIPSNVEQAVVKALAKESENRFQDMGAFARILEKIAAGKSFRIFQPRRIHPPRWFSSVAAGIIGSMVTILILGFILIFGGLIPKPSLQPITTQTNTVSHASATDTAEPALTLTPTQYPSSTATWHPSQTPMPGFSFYFGEIPVVADGTWDVAVDNGEIHVWTSGPVCVAGVCLPGGETRGSVVLMLPSEQPYLLTGLVPGANWHGEYLVPNNEQWQELADDRVNSMRLKGNCTDGLSCSIVDVLVVGPDGIVHQYFETVSDQKVYPISTSEVKTDYSHRPRIIANVGTGALEQVFYSDGEAEFSEEYLNSHAPRVLQLTNGDDPDGCGTAIFPSSWIWFGTTKQTVISVNGEEIGSYTASVATGRHGYLISWPVATDDIICVQKVADIEFHIVIGPDVEIWYDSFYFRDDEK